MLDRTFAAEFLETLDDPAKHGVHLLFNSYWRHMPDDVRAKYVAALHADPELKRFVEARWFPEPYAFDGLADLPRGSLGYAYYRHIIDNGLNPEIATGYRGFHQMLEASGALERMPDEVKYMVLRGFQTHDLLHMITGMSTTGLGEIALQAFCLAQLPSLYFATWMSVSTTRAAFLDPDAIAPLMDAITEGWRLGRQLPNLQVVRWEEHLHRDLAELRREYGVPEHYLMPERLAA